SGRESSVPSMSPFTRDLGRLTARESRMQTRVTSGYDLRAVARPPLRPAAFFCAVLPPCDELLRRVPDPEDFPPRLDEPGEFEMRAARSFDIPFSFSFSYCFSFFTLGRLLGMTSSLSVGLGIVLGRGVVLLRVRSGRLVLLLVPVVLARVHILVRHEGPASRPNRT